MENVRLETFKLYKTKRDAQVKLGVLAMKIKKHLYFSN